METSKTTRTEVLPGVWLDSRRAVFLSEPKLLLLADLHWGYAAAHRAAGNLVPMWGDELIARTLKALLLDYKPDEMLWLGDSLHAYSGRHSAEMFLKEAAESQVPVTVIAGNHDRKWSVPSCRLLERGRFLFHHGDLPVPPPSTGTIEVLGHFHPAASLYDRAGTRLRVPALVCSDTRMILPAFSPWAAGVSWNERLRPAEILWAIAPSRIFAVRPTRTQSPAG